MLDKIAITTSKLPDEEYLKANWTIVEDTHRRNLYKYLCRLPKATILWWPHKFSDATNCKMAQSKVELNPKHFSNYDEMISYLFLIFGFFNCKIRSFKISRLDLAADIEGISTNALLSVLRVNGARADNLSLYKGSIYVGSNPKIRIYDKPKEIKSRIKKGWAVTDYEKGLVESGKIVTRFEIEMKNMQLPLAKLETEAYQLSSWFDRLQIFKFPDNDGSGVLQTLYKYINRKFRAELEQYRDLVLVEEIKAKYQAGLKEWFKKPSEEP